MNVKIEDEIKRIRDAFGPIRERNSRSVPFTYLMRLFDAVKKHLSGVIGDEIALRMLLAAKKIEKTVGTLLKKTEVNEIGNASYAQVARRGAAAPKIEYSQAVEPPKENPIKEKQLLVRIINIMEAEAIYKLSTRVLMECIIINTNDGQRTSGIITAYQLLNRDVQVHLTSRENKRRFKREMSWIGNLGVTATIKKKIYKVLVHNIRVIDFPRDSGEENARHIKNENEKFH